MWSRRQRLPVALGVCGDIHLCETRSCGATASTGGSSPVVIPPGIPAETPPCQGLTGAWKGESSQGGCLCR